MDKKTLRNLILDISVFVLYVIVATPAMTGIAVHEWLGVGIYLVLFVHVLFHMDWVIKTTKRVFSHPTFSQVFNYIIDVLLFLTLTLVVISGILISGDFLRAFGLYANGYYFWDPIHAFSAKLLLALLVVHIVAHLQWFVGLFKRGNKNKPADSADTDTAAENASAEEQASAASAAEAREKAEDYE